jgi:fructose-1,6-bisphosphatase/inositol monophosphatase family enzyme
MSELTTLEYVRLAEVEEGRIDDPEEALALTVVYNSMLVVRRGQLTSGFVDSGPILVKPDGTILTKYDEASEALGNAVKEDMAPHMRYRGEEGTRSGSGSRELGEDALDGSRNFGVGGTEATVLVSIYDEARNVVGAAIGKPSNGHIYSAFGNRPTEGRAMVLDGNIARTAHYREDVTTWQGDQSDNGQWFIDYNLPFPRNGHATMTAEQHMAFRARLQAIGAGVLEVGSNGANYLAVASGANRSTVATTTARGVWEDTSAGLFLVERSGGATARFAANGGVISLLELGHGDYHDHDLAIGANNAANRDQTAEMLLELSAA